MTRIVLGIIALLMLAWSSAWAAELAGKKLIYYGWGIRDTQYVRDHWQEMERIPFDGTGIIIAIDRRVSAQRRRIAENELSRHIMGARLLRVEQFREGIDDLKSAKWQRFSENFLPVILSTTISSEGLDWFDDQRWDVIINNFRVLAQIAAEAGMRGLIFDPEHYTYRLFSYGDQRKRIDKPFGEYEEVARLRGRQVITAIASQLPNVVVLSLFGHSLPLSEMERGVSRQSIPYALLPAFFDGILEAMPGGGRLVDGYEFAYGFKERQQFQDAYRRIHDNALRLSLVPKDYRDKVQAGFGLWLDNNRRVDYFTPNEFERAVRDALAVSDRYVWIYSQTPQFFPPSAVDSRYIDALRHARR
jgi:hypothetical protein